MIRCFFTINVSTCCSCVLIIRSYSWGNLRDCFSRGESTLLEGEKNGRFAVQIKRSWLRLPNIIGNCKWLNALMADFMILGTSK